jgi:hypothetical protein
MGDERETFQTKRERLRRSLNACDKDVPVFSLHEVDAMVERYELLLASEQVAAHHDRVACSRREWIDAATEWLGAGWSGGPDDLRREIATLRARVKRCECEHHPEEHDVGGDHG